MVSGLGFEFWNEFADYYHINRPTRGVRDVALARGDYDLKPLVTF
jgi:hypothetical protein